MEDIFSVAYQQTDDEKDLEYAFFGIFDGHGGREAAQFAKDNLMEYITKNSKFWADDDDTVLRAIREGFMETQKAMWKDLPNWRKTASGLPSTAGTTASICFIKRGKLFIGHVGDSGIILGERDPMNTTRWRSRRLTQDHKPESEAELSRIREAGGKVVSKSGVPRVVWYRPSGGHQGPVRRSTHIDEVPFLAVARALGDLWSYNAKDDTYVVSPDPDLHVYDLNILKDRCLVLATDGVWNVVTPDMAVQSVFEAERNNEQHMIDPNAGVTWINPSKKLVDLAIDRWNGCNLRADNTSVVTVMLDPPGPPRAQVLRKLHQKPAESLSTKPSVAEVGAGEGPQKVTKGIAIISRYPNSADDGAKTGQNLIGTSGAEGPSVAPPRIVHDSTKSAPLRVQPEVPTRPPLQCNEVSSSDDESTPPVPKRQATGSNPALANRRSNNMSRELAALQNTDGPYKRTRRQSGPAGPPPPPLPSRRSVLINGEDSDAENNLPNRKQGQGNRKSSGSTNSVAPKDQRAKTPEVSPRVLRSRNTPASAAVSETTRKRQRSTFESTSTSTSSSSTNSGISSKMKKSSTALVVKTPTNSRAKSLRSRMN